MHAVGASVILASMSKFDRYSVLTLWAGHESLLRHDVYSPE
jgi:hypothetical protein